MVSVKCIPQVYIYRCKVFDCHMLQSHRVLQSGVESCSLIVEICFRQISPRDSRFLVNQHLPIARHWEVQVYYRLCLPSPLLEIRKRTFEICSRLAAFFRTERRPSIIGDMAFMGCEFIMHVRIPLSVTQIRQYMFVRLILHSVQEGHHTNKYWSVMYHLLRFDMRSVNWMRRCCIARNQSYFDSGIV
jgi:hypothetical protein